MSAIQGRSINGPRNGLPPSTGYRYGGTGRDELTPPKEMTRWYRQVRALGANPRPTNQVDIARLAAAENALALGRLPRAKRPAPQQVTRPVPLSAMSVACWDDDCPSCPGGPCKCACHDEPPPRPVAGRCEDCGYLTSAAGHKITCGGEA